jgi:uncharacterized membrane protein YoaK (UPF0700 family)
MTPARHLILGMVLTGAAGFVDVIGFIELGGYFTSFMSGNTTQGGAALAEGNWSLIGLTLALVGLFFIGSVVGNLLAISNFRWGPPAVSGFVTLGVGLALGLVRVGVDPARAMIILALAAGAQNAILPMRGAVRIGATFVTGTLYIAGQDLALALRGNVPRWRWVQHLVIWLGLFAGGLIGALLYRALGIQALALPVLVYAAFASGHLIAAIRLASAPG